MSSRNVELVRTLIPGPEVEIAALLRDDGLFEQLANTLAELIDPEVECVAMWQAGKAYRGIEGFRDLWLDWIEPWSTYHVGVDELIDLGGGVLALARDRATRDDTDREFELVSASLWELEGDRLRRVRFYRNRDEALRAHGLA